MVLMKSLRRGELADIFIVLNACFGRTGRRKNQFSFSSCNVAWNIIFVSWTYKMQCSFVCTLSSHNFWNMPPVVPSRHHPQNGYSAFISCQQLRSLNIKSASRVTLTMTPPWCENVRTCAESAQLSSAVSKGSHDPTVSTGELATQQSRDSNRGQNNTASL